MSDSDGDEDLAYPMVQGVSTNIDLQLKNTVYN